MNQTPIYDTTCSPEKRVGSTCGWYESKTQNYKCKSNTPDPLTVRQDNCIRSALIKRVKRTRQDLKKYIFHQITKIK